MMLAELENILCNLGKLAHWLGFSEIVQINNFCSNLNCSITAAAHKFAFSKMGLVPVTVFVQFM